MSAPGNPRDYSKLSFAAGNAAVFGGSPGEGTLFNNKLVYPLGDYTPGTDAPQIRIFDGITDRGVASIPKNVDGVICKAIISMIAVNGTGYLTTLDAGASSADWEGRVFEFSPDSGDLIPLGARFTAGEIPYALAWHMGRLWLGTNNGIGTVGKIYFLRPDIDTVWTLDHSLATDAVGGVCCMLSHTDGKLYVGTDAAAGTFAKVLVRDDAGVYTTSDTGFTGTARVNNAFLSLCTFGGNLYAGYFNNDTAKLARIRKWNGAAWSTVYTGVGSTIIPYQQLFLDDATGLMYVVGGGLLIQGVLLSTPDGTTYTDLSAQLFGPATCLPLHAMLVLR